MYRTFLTIFALLSTVGGTLAQQGSAKEPKVVVCTFKGQPQIILTFRGGMGADNNTVQIGQHVTVPLAVGSSLSCVIADGKDYVFSLRSPASVTIGAKTFSGKCVSTLQARPR